MMSLSRNFWMILLLPLLLAACTAPSLKPEVDKQITAEMGKATQQHKAAAITEPSLLPPLAVELPKSSDSEARFDLSLVNAPAQQVFMALVTGTRYNMLVTPEVSGQITISLKDVTVREALDSIREMYGYEYQVKGNRITILPNTIQTRVFQVNYLANRRQGQSDLRVTSSSISDSAGAGAAAGGVSAPASPTLVPQGTGSPTTSNAGSLNSRVRTTTDSDFWKDLTTALTAIVGNAEGRNVVVNAGSGVIVVRGLPREIRAVESYLKATQIIVERQVMLEAKIIDVTLNNDFQSGINWAAFGHAANGAKSAAGVVAPGTTLGTTGTLVDANGNLVIPGIGGAVQTAATAPQGFFGLAFQTSSFAALMNFLETQGKISVLSSPRIATVNNQQALLKVGTDELFVTNVTSTTTTTTTGTTNAPSITLTPYFSGIALDVTPQIDDSDNIVLHVHPAVSNVTEEQKVINLGSLGTFTLPLATSAVSETDSIVRVQDGQIVAIGGLMTQNQTNNRSQIPELGDVPVVGALFGQRTTALDKRELVILIKPTLIRDDRGWADDLDSVADRLSTMKQQRKLDAE